MTEHLPPANDAPVYPAPPLIPRHLLFGVSSVQAARVPGGIPSPEHEEPALSPTGDQVAWLAPSNRGVLNMWVSDLRVQGSARVLTRACGSGVRWFAWAPDSLRLLFALASDRKETCQLHDVDVATGDVRALTPSGCRARLIKVSRRHPDTVLITLDADDPYRHDVYELHLPTAALKQVFTGGIVEQVVADDNLVVRAAATPRPDGRLTILVREHATAAWTQLLTVGADDAMSTKLIGFDAFGRRLLCITSDGATAAQLLWLHAGPVGRQVVASDPNPDVTGVLLDRDGEPRIAYIHKSRLESVILDPTIRRDVEITKPASGDATIVCADDLDTTWPVASHRAQGPARYYTYDRATRQLKFLHNPQPELDRYLLAEPEPFAILAQDGSQLRGYVTYPLRTPRQRLPAVHLVHGGDRDSQRAAGAVVVAALVAAVVLTRQAVNSHQAVPSGGERRGMPSA